MSDGSLIQSVEKSFETIIPALEKYIRVPNQSPAFDPDIHKNGHQEAAVKVLLDWVEQLQVKGLKHTLYKEPERTPLILFEVPANKCSLTETLLMYGHMDKQPPMTEAWAAGLGPYTPVIRDGKLYGRGGADDGYSTFAALASIKALQEQDLPHPRIVVMIEGSEESGSIDLDFYLEKVGPLLGAVGLIICLDSGCGNYEQMWVTTSLRGLLACDLKVQVLEYGVHSGAASGVVPSSFRIMRAILDQLEDSKTGRVLIPELWVDIPPNRVQEAKQTADILGRTIISEFPFAKGVQPVIDDPAEALLNKTWRPQLAVIGAAGIPSLEKAGNVLRKETVLKLSFRLPPTLSPDVAKEALDKLLKGIKVPYGANISWTLSGGSGWNAPETRPWLNEAMSKASETFWKRPAAHVGEGGSIPFMGMLGRRFPQAQFMIVGVLGPHSNAHGPDEFLDIDFAKKLTACVAKVATTMGERKTLQ